MSKQALRLKIPMIFADLSGVDGLLGDVMRKGLYMVFLIMMTVGCGSDANVFGVLTSPKHKESFDYLVTEGQAAYDRNDLETALELSRAALDLNPRSERAAVLYGFVNLALAGIDAFNLSRLLSETGTKTEGGEKVGADESQDNEKPSTGSNAVLTQLQSTIGLTEEEFSLLGRIDRRDPDLPVFLPKCVEEVRGAVPSLIYVDQAVVAICPFVDEGAKINSDYRQDCDAYDASIIQGGKIHYLWAFAHLAEALAFHKSLTYGVDEDGSSNLERRVKKLESRKLSSPSDLDGFIAELETVEQTVSAVFPVSGECSPQHPTSQLRATLNDMLTVEAAFQRVPGIPDRIKASIRSAMAGVTKIKSSTKTQNVEGSKTQAFKSDLTKAMSKGLSAKLDELAETSGQDISAEQAEALCDAFASISAGGEATPKLCETP